jgi:hypothetical protein
MATKTSTALLAAWFVVIAGLIAAIVFFFLQGGSDEPAPPDAKVVPLTPKPGVKPKQQHGTTRKPGDRGGRGSDPSKPAKRLEISGTVKLPGGVPVAGAHVALFEPTKPGRSATPPDMDELRMLSSLIYIQPEDFESPRRLTEWTGDADRSQGSEGELAGDDTKEDGTFRITLPSRHSTGPYRLVASKEKVGQASVSEVTPGEENLQLVLGPAAAVKGVVVTEVESTPVEGAHVTFDDGARRFRARTDAAGAFTADGVTPGYYILSVAAKGRTPLFDAKFKVEAAWLAPVTLRMPRGTKLVIKAVVEKDDPNAAARRPGELPSDPIEGATVVALHEATNTYVMGRTNHDGVVEFPGMPAGAYVLNGSAKGVVSISETTMLVDQKELTQEETILFEKAIETPIEVVDEDGRPLSGVDFFTVNNEDKYDQVRSIRVGTTDSDGKLAFPFEWDGPRSKLFGFRNGYTVVYAAPIDRESGDLLKLVAKKPARVHGVVKSSDGRPVPGAYVLIDIASSDPTTDTFEDFSLQVRADAEGRYEFAHLPRVEGVTLSAAGPDGISQDDKELEFEAGKNDYEVDLLLDLDDLPEPIPQPKRAKPDPEKK